MSIPRKGNLQITDLHIDETKILDVMAAALFFDCFRVSWNKRESLTIVP